MPRMTIADYMAWESRQRRSNPVTANDTNGVSRESELHDEIISECKRRGWKYVHSRMDRKTTVGEGVCDFIIYADGGRMFHVESKSLKGKLSMEQLAFIAWVEKLGHKVHVMTSFAEFLKAVK